MTRSQKHFGELKRIHLIGIGGSGMIGLAMVLQKKGFNISGSDLQMTEELSSLKALGAKVQLGHDPRYIKSSDVVVASSAIAKNNAELKYAKKNNITIIPRAVMLASILHGYRTIAVSGSHGKTTTTSLISNIFDAAKLSPTYVVGGQILGGRNSSHLGDGLHMIVEADESDGSFLHLHPEVIVITNIDNDHLSFYENDQQKLNTAFLNFTKNLPFYGYVLMNIDSKNARDVFKKIRRKKISFGFSKLNDYQIKLLNQKGFSQTFSIEDTLNSKNTSFTIPMLGKHNVLNAAGSAIIAMNEGIKMTSIKKALLNFPGVARRFERYELSLPNRDLLLIDDYGHHPEEIRSTFESALSVFNRSEIVMIFEPHRYTRTEQLFDDFVDVLKKIKEVYLLEIYSASERKIPKITSANLVKAINKEGGNAEILNPANLANKILSMKKSNKVIIMQGAGKISSYLKNFVESCQVKK